MIVGLILSLLTIFLQSQGIVLGGEGLFFASLFAFVGLQLTKRRMQQLATGLGNYSKINFVIGLLILTVFLTLLGTLLGPIVNHLKLGEVFNVPSVFFFGLSLGTIITFLRR